MGSKRIQSDNFKEGARGLKADEDEPRLEQRLRKVAGAEGGEAGMKPRPWEWLIPFSMATFCAYYFVEGWDAESWIARIFLFALMFSFPILVLRHRLRKEARRTPEKPQ